MKKKTISSVNTKNLNLWEESEGELAFVTVAFLFRFLFRLPFLFITFLATNAASSNDILKRVALPG